MAKLTRFGKKALERFAQAAAEAERAQAQMQAVAQNPGWLVSQKADDFDTMDKVAQQLSRAFAKALNPDPSSVAFTRFDVAVVPDIAAFRYKVTFTDRLNSVAPQGWLVDDEILVANTRSVELFHSWIAACTHRLKLMLGVGIAGIGDATRQQAMEELAAFGLHPAPDYDSAPPFAWEPSPEEQAAEERAAIESILKAATEQ